MMPISARRRSRPVVLDMDPGVDDALAILLAMRSSELNVSAITVCGGNTKRPVVKSPRFVAVIV